MMRYVMPFWQSVLFAVHALCFIASNASFKSTRDIIFSRMHEKNVSARQVPTKEKLY